MAIKFQTNIPQRLAFPFGDFKEVEGQYGLQYMYSVDVDGDRAAREKLYASEALHALLQSVYPDDAMRGQLLDICKREGDKGRNYWDVESDGQLVASSATPAAEEPAAPARAAAPTRPATTVPARPAAPAQAPAPRAVASAPTAAPQAATQPQAATAIQGALPHPAPKPGYQNLRHLLNQCVEDAIGIWEDHPINGGEPIDPAVIQATAATLFIQTCHHNIILPVTPPLSKPAPRPAPRPIPPPARPANEPPPHDESEAPPELDDQGNELPFS